ncbi:MAG TPA: polyketide synthase [Cyanobacteria bacterium UBA8553]|nr:polyketide synthase [Cyanobacteria bacterium UBA8553]HAJ59942.1 polyketide synthase [Cyanobacteria bacterium UBA8543]
MIKPSSVFLVSGGGKGITAQCAIELAQQQPCNFILLGRSAIAQSEPTWAKDCFDESELKKHIMEDLLAKGEKPKPMMIQKVFNTISSNREIRKTISTIEQAGGKAEYLSVDVTNTAAVQEKIPAAVERMGAITGIIHGAGNLADKLIEKKTEEDFDSVYTAKVKGLENLLSCVDKNQLDYLVLFSSVTGFYGNVGQTDYAIANEILNKSAHLVKQQHPSCHVVAINWGPWDSGMVTPLVKKALTERNIEILPVDVGTKMLVNELHEANHTTAQVVIGSPIIPEVTQVGSELKTYRICRKLTLEANPFLQDHVIAGYPVLPATCAIAWGVNACEQLYPGYKFSSATNMKILKGIVFDDTLASEYVQEIQEIAKTPQEIEFTTKTWSKSKAGKTHYHYSSQIKLVKPVPLGKEVIPNYEAMDLTVDGNFDNSVSFYQCGGASLFHGPSFHGVTRVLNINPEKITIECVWNGISDREKGQFPVQTFNPYTADIESHIVWVWLQHFHQSVCLPASQDRFEHFAEIPLGEPFYVTCEIKSKAATSIVSDIITHTLQGKIYSRMLGAKGTIFPLDQARGMSTSK